MKAFLLLSVLLCCAADVDVDVQTPLGVIRGTERSSTAKVFRGVRFAEPPKGALRFVAPVAVANWSGVYDATAFGFGCPQLHHNPDVPQPQDEDCLFLNVFVPPTSCGPDLAVMFWIHGGSFAEGGGSLYFYDGENLAAGTCTIVVTHNYRLGALGFLVADGVGGDMGIDDQRAALRWVRDNIAAFGGNPSNVCVFGQSAGAMSISIHLTSAASEGLFQRAILESPPAAFIYKSAKQAAHYGTYFSKYANCSHGGLECLQKAPLAAILDADKKAAGAIPPLIEAGLTIDRALTWTPSLRPGDVDAEPLLSIMAGKFRAMPILLGSVKDEGIMFIGCKGEVIPPPLYDGGVLAVFGAAGVKILKAYPSPRGKGANAAERVNEILTDFWFRCPARRIAAAYAQQGGAVFSYRFTHQLSVNPTEKACCKDHVCHASEVPLLFHALGNYTLTAAEEELSKEMMAYWGSFAKTGNPNNGGASVVWPQFEAATQLEVLFHDDVAVESAAGGVCDMWDSFGYKF